MTRTWPADWDARKRGDACLLCGELASRPFYTGRTSAAILERNGIAKGHVAVVFRGRHVADLTALSARELADFWLDIQHVGRAVESVFGPCHVNYQLLGNIAPHLHVHIVPRYLDDAAPERPLPWETRPVPAEEYAAQFQKLQDSAAALNA